MRWIVQVLGAGKAGLAEIKVGALVALVPGSTDGSHFTSIAHDAPVDGSSVVMAPSEMRADRTARQVWRKCWLMKRKKRRRTRRRGPEANTETENWLLEGHSGDFPLLLAGHFADRDPFVLIVEILDRDSVGTLLLRQVGEELFTEFGEGQVEGQLQAPDLGTGEIVGLDGAHAWILGGGYTLGLCWCLEVCVK